MEPISHLYCVLLYCSLQVCISNKINVLNMHTLRKGIDATCQQYFLRFLSMYNVYSIVNPYPQYPKKNPLVFTQNSSQNKYLLKHVFLMAMCGRSPYTSVFYLTVNLIDLSRLQNSSSQFFICKNKKLSKEKLIISIYSIYIQKNYGEYKLYC